MLPPAPFPYRRLDQPPSCPISRVKPGRLTHQVETLVNKPTSPSQPAYHARSPSFPSNPNPYRATTPSSPAPIGVDNIPCGPASSANGHGHASENPYGISPGSMSPASPRGGGGVEALRLSRASFSALNLSGTPGRSTPGALTSNGTGSGSGSGSGSGLIQGQASGSGSSTPYGNLSLAGAVAGGGAPGSATPAKEEEGDKKKALYPSRVVLTSEYL